MIWFLVARRGINTMRGWACTGRRSFLLIFYENYAESNAALYFLLSPCTSINCSLSFIHVISSIQYFIAKTSIINQWFQSIITYLFYKFIKLIYVTNYCSYYKSQCCPSIITGERMNIPCVVVKFAYHLNLLLAYFVLHQPSKIFSVLGCTYISP
jgi:hypothetical protein